MTPFWQWMVYKDDLILDFFDFLRGARRLWGLRSLKYKRLGDRLIKSHRVEDGAATVVLNAPSIKQQPLERLKGQIVFCANQAFRLPQYKEIHPRYHVFIDTKLIKGIWDIKWIDEILGLVPDITFVMPADWALLPLLKPYIDRNVKILWIGDWRGGVRGMGVSEACFDLAQKLGFRTIYFTGFEATAFASSLVNRASHFYGSDADEEGKPMEVIMQEYYMNARQIRELLLYAEKAKKNGVRMVNLTKGGILDMFERVQFEDVFNK